MQIKEGVLRGSRWTPPPHPSYSYETRISFQPPTPTKENIPEYINPELFTYVLYSSYMYSLKSK